MAAVQANAGQPVKEGDVLLQIEPSADARLALDTARAAKNAAETALKDVQRRFNAHLATNADLATAQQRRADGDGLRDAVEQRAERERGAAASGLLRAA